MTTIAEVTQSKDCNCKDAFQALNPAMLRVDGCARNHRRALSKNTAAQACFLCTLSEAEPRVAL